MNRKALRRLKRTEQLQSLRWCLSVAQTYRTDKVLKAHWIFLYPFSLDLPPSILFIHTNKTKMIHATLSFKALQHLPNLPVPSDLSQVLCASRTEGSDQRSSSCGSCAVLSAQAVFSAWDGTWNRTPSPSRPAPKSLGSHSCHSSPLLNLEMVFSFLTLRINEALHMCFS